MSYITLSNTCRHSRNILTYIDLFPSKFLFKWLIFVLDLIKPTIELLVLTIFSLYIIIDNRL